MRGRCGPSYGQYGQHLWRGGMSAHKKTKKRNGWRLSPNAQQFKGGNRNWIVVHTTLIHCSKLGEVKHLHESEVQLPMIKHLAAVSFFVDWLIKRLFQLYLKFNNFAYNSASLSCLLLCRVCVNFCLCTGVAWFHLRFMLIKSVNLQFSTYRITLFKVYYLNFIIFFSQKETCF